MSSFRIDRRSACRGVVALLAAVALHACAPLTTAESPADIATASPQWLEGQKHEIAKRAHSRWQELIAGKLDAAYEYETPAYRAVFSAQQYKAKFGGAARWKNAQVLKVEYNPAQVALVSVEVKYAAALPGGTEFEGNRVMKERWLYSNGDWWYISE